LGEMRLRPPPLACTTVAEAVGWARRRGVTEAFRLPEDDPHQILRVARGTDYLGLLSARREARAKAEAEGDEAQVVKVEAAFRTFVDGAEKRFKEAVDTAPDDAAALYMVPALPHSLPPRLRARTCSYCGPCRRQPPGFAQEPRQELHLAESLNPALRGERRAVISDHARLGIQFHGLLPANAPLGVWPSLSDTVATPLRQLGRAV